MLQHFEEHGVLTNLQHGFRSGFSCETQLLITTHDILQSFDKKKQQDIVILDFSKAFDTVPHDRLLEKLEHMGVHGNLHEWIKAFLTNRSQSVLVDGVCSSAVSVDSGVPQGSVLGPLLFLCHINDLPNRVTSQVRMFADDCLLYREIRSQDDHIQLQNDLVSLEQWAEMWGMSFNPIKCYVMRIGRGKKLSDWIYTLCGEPLEQVETNPYLGVLLSHDTKWAPHIDKITSKANRTIGFLRRNLKKCPEELKQTAYISLVRSTLEYSCTIWDPHYKKDITKLEAVQRQAARFVKNDYGWTSSVTQMLQDLEWQSLETRRREARLVLLYKVIHGLVAVPTDGHVSFVPVTTRASNTMKLHQYNTDHSSVENSFFPRTIIDWNNLPPEAVKSETVDVFKSKINRMYD